MARGRLRPRAWPVTIALLGVLAGGTAWMRDATTPTARFSVLRSTPSGPYPMAATVDARAGRGFVVHQDGTVDVLEMASGRISRRARVGQFGYNPGDIAASEGTDRVFIATGGTTGQGTTVAVLDARTGAVLRTVAVGPYPHDVTVDAPRGQIFVATQRGVRVLDARTGDILRAIPIGGVVQRIALDARAGHLFVATEGTDKRGLIPITGGAGTVLTLDARSGKLLRAVAVGREPAALAVDPHARRLFVASPLDGTVAVLDTGTGRVVRTVRVGGQPEAVAVDGWRGLAFVATMGHMDSMGRFTSPSGVVALDARGGTVVRTVSLGPSPLWRIVADERAGRVYALLGSTTTALDAGSGAIVGAMDGVYGVMAVDVRTGRVIIASPGGMATARDPLGWLPRGLRRLPFLPPPPRPRSVQPAVTILGPAH